MSSVWLHCISTFGSHYQWLCMSVSLTFNLQGLSITMKKCQLRSYHFPAGATGGLTASQAGRGIRHSIVTTHWVPVLQRAGTAHVALWQQSLLVVGHLRSPGAHRHEQTRMRRGYWSSEATCLSCFSLGGCDQTLQCTHPFTNFYFHVTCHSPLIWDGKTSHLCVVAMDEALNEKQTKGANRGSECHPGCSNDTQLETFQHKTSGDDAQGYCRQVQYTWMDE